MKSPGFMLYYDDVACLASMPDEQVGRLIKALADEEENVPAELRAMYLLLKNKVTRDEERYAKICETNRRNSVAYWSNRTDTERIPNDNRADTERIPNDNQTDTDGYPTVTVTVNETVTTPSINKNKKEEDARAREALIEEVRERYIHGSSVLESKMNMLIRKYGVEAVRKELDARTIYELQWRLEHDEAAD